MFIIFSIILIKVIEDIETAIILNDVKVKVLVAIHMNLVKEFLLDSSNLISSFTGLNYCQLNHFLDIKQGLLRSNYGEVIPSGNEEGVYDMETLFYLLGSYWLYS